LSGLSDLLNASVRGSAERRISIISRGADIILKGDFTGWDRIVLERFEPLATHEQLSDSQVQNRVKLILSKSRLDPPRRRGRRPKSSPKDLTEL
jgi:hypothetical protein